MHQYLCSPVQRSFERSQIKNLKNSSYQINKNSPASKAGEWDMIVYGMANLWSVPTPGETYTRTSDLYRTGKLSIEL
jgi:hypothetical protein